MYTIKTYVGPSSINGVGVFADQAVPQGKIVWRYDPKQDLALTQADFAQLNQAEKQRFLHSAYLSPWSQLWICPPVNEAGNFTNHSANNNTSVVFDEAISSEPYFVANRDIAVGEEITNNYHEFDEITRQQNPEWAHQKGRADHGTH